MRFERMLGRLIGDTNRPRCRLASRILGFMVILIVGCENGNSRADGDTPIRDARNKPNIVLMIVDTLRADRLGAYGNPAGLTPAIDMIASEGVLFEQCVASSPWTLPSISSLFCSFYPSVHKTVSFRTVEDMKQGRAKKVRIFDKADQFDTIPEFLHEIGYATAGISANPFIQEEYGFGAGFDFWDGSFAENTVPGKEVNDAAISWLEGAWDADRPFFLYLHYMDVHGPYDAEPRFLDPLVELLRNDPGQKLTSREFKRLNGYIRKPPKNDSHPEWYESLRMYRKYWSVRYDAGVRESDHYLGELVTYLKQRRLWDNAYVIVTADHGEALNEHDHWEHGYSQHQTDLHVPLVLRWPGVLPAGERVSQRVRLIDLFPTLVEQLDASTAIPDVQGESLLPLILGSPDAAGRLTFAEALKGSIESGYEQQAVFDGPWKLIQTTHPPHNRRSRNSDPSRTTFQLYHLVDDPRENTNLAETEQETVAAMRDLLEKQAVENRTIRPRVIPHERVIPESTSRKLESLGYVGEEDSPGTGDEQS